MQRDLPKKRIRDVHVDANIPVKLFNKLSKHNYTGWLKSNSVFSVWWNLLANFIFTRQKNLKYIIEKVTIKSICRIGNSKDVTSRNSGNSNCYWCTRNIQNVWKNYISIMSPNLTGEPSLASSFKLISHCNCT